MKVLWITNGLLPEAKAHLSGASVLKGSGGWIMAMAEELHKKPDVLLFLAATTPLVKKLTIVQGEYITYYAIPYGKGDKKYNDDYEYLYRVINKEAKPDIVHIHGTEFPHSLAAIRVFGGERTIVSLQGMISGIESYYLGGIPRKTFLRNITFRDLLRQNIFHEQRMIKRRSAYEVETLKIAKYIIGRTTWDRSHSWVINPAAFYFHCDEILREEFYSGKWRYNYCKPHTIFASQGYYPLKGLHKLIAAMGIVVKHYPDATLRVAGCDITYRNGSFLDKFRISSYGKIVLKCIKKNYLDEQVVFTGMLNANEMKKEYLNCNVFVCPSSIENSPNSLGEAQILGVPSLASFVGGSPDMMSGGENGLYRFEDVEELAYKICSIFAKEERVCTDLLYNKACHRHDKKSNSEKLIEIYRQVLVV